MHYTFGKPPANTDVLWRCTAERYSYVVDYEADIYAITDPRLEMRWYKVEKRTPKGAWLSDRFVLLTANKRYACNTEEEAIESFIARRKRQIQILEGQLRKAKADLALTEKKVFA